MRRALVFTLLFAGCGSGEPRPESGVERKPVYEDVPAYAGLEYVDGTGKRNPEFRSAKQEYRGDAKVDDVLGFYRKAMPVHGWALSGENAGTLTYTKKSEKCAIAVTTDSSNKTVVSVTLSYKG